MHLRLWCVQVHTRLHQLSFDCIYYTFEELAETAIATQYKLDSLPDIGYNKTIIIRHAIKKSFINIL